MSVGSITEAYSVLAPYRNAMITKQGSLVMGFSVSGIEPDTVSENEAQIYSSLFEIALDAIPASYTLEQYYLHLEDFKVNIKSREIPIVSQLSKAREKALNKRGLAHTQLVYILEAPDPNGLNTSLLKAILHGLKSVADPELFRAAKAKILKHTDIVLRSSELEQRYIELENTMREFGSRLSQFINIKPYNINELYSFQKFLATGNSHYIRTLSENICPDDFIDVALSDGDVSEVSHNYVPSLKLDGAVPVYCKIANANAFPEHLNNTWLKGNPSALCIRGNYVIHYSIRFLSAVQKEVRFWRKDAELKRSTVKPIQLLTNKASEDISPTLKKKLEDIENLREIDERSADSFTSVIVYDHNPKRLHATAQKLSSVLASRGFPVSWDSAGLPLSYKTIHPGGHSYSYRKQFSHASTVAELSLKYTHKSGPDRINFSQKTEEPAYIFETRAGSPLYYNPISGGRNFLIGNGPTRSGKSFTRMTLATHLLKYGTHISMIDIDPGAEALAQLLQKDGGIFRGESDSSSALNPFSTALQTGEKAFTQHFIKLSQMLLASNEAEDARTINTKEQQEIDEAIHATLRLPPENRNFKYFISHLPNELENKFSRWVNDGAFSGIFDGETDALGGFDKPYSAYNLHSFRDTPSVFQPFLLELFHRITFKYEKSLPLSTLKILDIDEAHHAVRSKEFCEYLQTKTVTWGKYNAGINLWTQSPAQLVDIEWWPAILGALTTKFFFSDPTADYSLYQRVYDLSASQVDTIKNLTPNREALLIQPASDVCEIVRLDVEPEQYVANTADPYEREIRQKLMTELGAIPGFKKAVEKITENRQERVA